MLEMLLITLQYSEYMGCVTMMLWSSCLKTNVRKWATSYKRRTKKKKNNARTPYVHFAKETYSQNVLQRQLFCSSLLLSGLSSTFLAAAAAAATTTKKRANNEWFCYICFYRLTEKSILQSRFRSLERRADFCWLASFFSVWPDCNFVNKRISISRIWDWDWVTNYKIYTFWCY